MQHLFIFLFLQMFCVLSPLSWKHQKHVSKVEVKNVSKKKLI